ncbi:acyl carrier protein [Streptomyces sp. TRM 70351]|uniref:acyl carrier protein n=1 Tax=Streptomyces sp. TRM 70351 TaxID=3116552 RepID=UPI002E7AE481|nr:acyl carrier protein [Streptomyces sp. TRM 70351]MEE1928886.1 acyl carrier protein [Streptomyces sp. TRM 70351]
MVPDRDELIGYLKAMYAEVLEYPSEMVTADIDLEAELGADSLQHQLVLARAAEHWGLRLPPESRTPTPLTPRSVAGFLLDAS